MKKTLTSKDLIIHLVESGYRYHKPKCRTWKLAFILEHTNSALCILFRKNGIDLRLYEQYKNEISIDENNQISMIGGKLFRNYYNESNNLITQKIKVISSCFTNSVGTGRRKVPVADATPTPSRSYAPSSPYR